MSKQTKKRTIIYSNVKENKLKAKKNSEAKSNQINLDDEVIIGMSNGPQNYTSDVKQNKKNKATKNKKRKATKPKKKLTKKQLKVRLLCIVIVFFTVIIAGISIFLLKAPLFNVKNIEITIENRNFLTEQEIRDLSLIMEDENLISISKRDTIDSIKNNSYVENVKIKKSLPNTIKIIVEERSIKFQLEHEGNYINIDNQGYVLEETTERNDVILISGYSTTDFSTGTRLNDKDLEKLSDVIQIMQEAKNQEIANEVTKIDIKSSNNYIIYMDNCGKVIHLGGTNLINDKFSYVKKIMEIEKDYDGEIIVNVDYNKGEYPYFREKV